MLRVLPLLALAAAQPSQPFDVEPFESDHGDACGRRLGLIVLSVDETIEHEYRRYFPYEQDSTL